MRGQKRLVQERGLQLPAMAAQVPVYVMGVVSAYWFVDRVLSMLPRW